MTTKNWEVRKAGREKGTGLVLEARTLEGVLVRLQLEWGVSDEQLTDLVVEELA